METEKIRHLVIQKALQDEEVNSLVSELVSTLALLIEKLIPMLPELETLARNEMEDDNGYQRH